MFFAVMSVRPQPRSITRASAAHQCKLHQNSKSPLCNSTSSTPFALPCSPLIMLRRQQLRLFLQGKTLALSRRVVARLSPFRAHFLAFPFRPSHLEIPALYLEVQVASALQELRLLHLLEPSQSTASLGLVSEQSTSSTNRVDIQ
ncbi:unnamed protein product [Somion occarium]|uniref:Uncharacterized protein n=1 Tax=Somion occarium TaxID=3059160 RepID=A0ABP1CID6_9APHY